MKSMSEIKSHLYQRDLSETSNLTCTFDFLRLPIESGENRLTWVRAGGGRAWARARPLHFVTQLGKSWELALPAQAREGLNQGRPLGRDCSTAEHCSTEPAPGMQSGAGSWLHDSFTLRDDIRIAKTRVIILMPPFIVRMSVTDAFIIHCGGNSAAASNLMRDWASFHISYLLSSVKSNILLSPIQEIIHEF